MISVFHTNEHRDTEIIVHAIGETQWLGDGYYFWQDKEFADEWATNKRNGYNTADIYKVELDITFSDDLVIDTVFNEFDYYKFVEKIEFFANKYQEIFEKKTSLSEFNNFIQDNNFKLWKNIVAIRFQDLPNNDRKDYLSVKGFYYKKRIQIALYDEKRIVASKIIETIINK